MTSATAWTADANEALSLSLGLSSLPTSRPCRAHACGHAVRAPEDKASLWSREVYEGFHPTYTYPVRLSLPFSMFASKCATSRYLAKRRRYTATKTSPCRYASLVALSPTPLITPQLKFASGSLAQFLHVRYSERLPSSSAVDEIEPTLSKFLAPDYLTDEKEFLERVEHDATHFKPYGEKIYSYTRAGTTLPKGKNVSIPQVLGPDDEETVDFEVYHVSARSSDGPFRYCA